MLLVPPVQAVDEAAAAFDAVALGRRTVRAFHPTPVPKEVLENILSIAARAPSTFNTQPWRVHVLYGHARQSLVKAILDAHAANTEPACHALADPAAGCLRRSPSREFVVTITGRSRSTREYGRAWSPNGAQLGFFEAPVGLMFRSSTA